MESKETNWNDLTLKERLALVNHNEQLDLYSVSGSAWDLPDGVYQVGVDKATKGSKDYSTRIWMKRGIRGEMVIVAEEHYR